MLQDRGGPADPPPMPAEPHDRSLRIHACHSPMREIEVLQKNLDVAIADALSWFRANGML